MRIEPSIIKTKRLIVIRYHHGDFFNGLDKNLKPSPLSNPLVGSAEFKRLKEDG
jgi:hypothetical protein